MSVLTTSQLKNATIILPPIEDGVQLDEIVRTSDLETALQNYPTKEDILALAAIVSQNRDEALTKIINLEIKLNEKIAKLENADLSQDALIASCVTNIANLKEQMLDLKKAVNEFSK